MLIINASLPKSGSTWLYNLVNAMLEQAGHPPQPEVFERQRLQSVVDGANGEIRDPSASKLARLLVPSLRRQAVSVRTHFAPTRSLRLMLKLGLAKAVYVYRDPRDVVLSAFDHGQREAHIDPPTRFGSLKTVGDSVRYVANDLLPVWNQWADNPHAHHVRYEDLRADTHKHVSAIAAYLGLAISDEQIQQTIRRFDVGALSESEKQKLRIYTAKSNRFEREMDAATLSLADELFAPYLGRMGYAA